MKIVSNVSKFEGHLRWDSLGEFLALAVSLEHLSNTTNNFKAKILSEALEEATAKFLLNKKSPSRIVNEIDNRGSHFYLTMYWAEALANQTKDLGLQQRFIKFSKELSENEQKINKELLAAQGHPVNLGGYYKPNFEMVSKAMRPSITFNTAIKALTDVNV